MPARGWYSSDDHIHLRRSLATIRPLRPGSVAEDIHVGNLLEMGDFWATFFSQYAFGDRDIQAMKNPFKYGERLNSDELVDREEEIDL
jgi:hypothetical protein